MLEKEGNGARGLGLEVQKHIKCWEEVQKRKKGREGERKEVDQFEDAFINFPASRSHAGPVFWRTVGCAGISSKP